MAKSTTGTDAWIEENHPNRNHSSGDVVKVQASERKGLLHMPIREITGRTVLSGYLVLHAHGSNTAQEITAHLITEGWRTDEVTWDNAPAPGTTQATSVGATDDGESVQVDIDDLLQEVADGTKWRGLLLTTDEDTAGASNWSSFDSGDPAFEIHYELSIAPAVPTDLRPDGGAVSTSTPTLAWSNVDLSGDSSEQDYFTVQVDPDQDGVSPAFEHTAAAGSLDPQLDLGDTAYGGLADGDDTAWRVQTFDSNGTESGWSDWATFSRANKRTLVFDSPIDSAVIGDPTPEVLAHLSAGTLTRYRLWVTAGGDRSNVKYDTGRRSPDAGSVATTIPWRDPDDDKRVIRRDDAAYQIGIRAWDEVDRAVSPGDPAWVEEWVTVTYDDDVEIEPPADFTVAEEVADGTSPRLTFTFTRSEAPEAIKIVVDGEVYARVDLEDLTADAGTYTWTDNAESPPYVESEFKIRALDAGGRSTAATFSFTPEPTGVWLMPEDHSWTVRLRGRGVGAFTKVQRLARYQPLEVDSPVDVIYGRNGLSGDFEGAIDAFQPTTSDVLLAKKRLETMFDDVGGRPRLIFASTSIRVALSSGVVTPSDQFIGSHMMHAVRFHFEEHP